MDRDFLLETPTAQKLFHEMADGLPIYDYHCHIDPREILDNRSYENLTQLWLYGDHYKWRLMRANGVPEPLITGDGGDYEKFLAFVQTLELCPGNPVYHWSHLELRRYFGIELTLTQENAPEIWRRCCAQLGQRGLHCRDFIEKSNVELICTTDDPADSLPVHEALEKEQLSFRVRPAFRPDRAMAVEKPGYLQYLDQLGESAGRTIRTFQDLTAALAQRVDYFHQHGCRLADSGLTEVPFAPAEAESVERAFQKVRQGQPVTRLERWQIQTALLLFLGQQYAARGWAMQLHIGALRNNNTRQFQTLGPDTGYDSVADYPCGDALQGLLDSLEQRQALPKTILYSLNPGDNYVLASMAGNFQGGVPGKMQLGAAWWMQDHIHGITEQLRITAELGVLGRFVGMLTDSRSFLSYYRHEYFRRIFCNFLGGLVERGEFPAEETALRRIVQGVCYKNAEEYFGL